jgi:hypothetical protein
VVRASAVHPRPARCAGSGAASAARLPIGRGSRPLGRGCPKPNGGCNSSSPVLRWQVGVKKSPARGRLSPRSPAITWFRALFARFLFTFQGRIEGLTVKN